MVRYGYLNRGEECVQTMLCPRYKDRALLIGKREAVSTGCARHRNR
jgi:hypothetical protein